ncbi:putative repeat protein (TIGR03943 family) [Fontibacillus phaseoli]|uniref:Putative repeat protein (TIGR03943 family) n=1 Tax=Fontibacillus phaseoli TaxID=1416533 RepID=A0A369BKW6_9BACL|nr:TIGR03943 family protein [Fontibacillus phaseoli]RCX20344.1 putative repeat protein (TIGR03943 family) [Fontibacillus phaseoli]
MMKEGPVFRSHELIRALILLGFALYIARLSATGYLQYYVAPEMYPWLRLSVIPLVALSLNLAYRALFGTKNGMDCHCERPVAGSKLKHSAIYALFILPLLLGSLLPDKALGVTAASKKGMILGSPVLTREQLDGKFKAPDKYNVEFAELAKLLYVQEPIEVKPEIYSEIVGAIQLFKEEFKGKKIRLSGFVYRDEGMSPDHEFVLGRFLVQCCTADAYPFGVPIRLQTNHPAIRNDAWLEVEGNLITEIREGREVIAVAAERVTEIPRPDTPYIYLNSKEVEQWIQKARESSGGIGPGSAEKL